MNSASLTSSGSVPATGFSRPFTARCVVPSFTANPQASMTSVTATSAPSKALESQAGVPEKSKARSENVTALSSANGRPTQKHRFAAISTVLGEDELLLNDFSISEQLGRLFEIEVDLVSQNTAIRFEDVVGTGVTVRLQLPGGRTRYFNGLISRFVQTQHERRFARYRATVVPWLWLLTRSS